MSVSLDKVALSGDLSVTIGDVAVGHNECVTRFSLNRNFRRLVENDKDLLTLYSRLRGGDDIDEWSRNISYKPGVLVWYTDSTGKLYLLRNMNLDNSTEPDINDFDSSGWRNENEYKTILDYGLETAISKLSRRLMKEHQDSDYHPFGSLSGISIMDTKILRRDFSNIDATRSSNFYPYVTVDMLSADPTLSDVVLDGYYRMYDNGLLEYDVIYRMGYVGTEEFEGDDYDLLSCNCVEFRDTSRLATKDPNRNEAGRYFYNTGDFSIFRYENNSTLSNYSIIGNTIQRNRNDYCNVYHAKIRFPQYFLDLGYSVFGSPVTCESDGGDSIKVVGSTKNQLVYCDKTIGSITALLITYPKDDSSIPGYNATHGGLMSNTFHFRAIGWRR